jgi:hypothetical protein
LNSARKEDKMNKIKDELHQKRYKSGDGPPISFHGNALAPHTYYTAAERKLSQTT